MDIQLPHVPLVRDVGFLISNVGRRATSHCLDDSQTICLSNCPGWLLCGARDKPDGLGLVTMGPSESLESVVAHANISSKVGAA